MLKMLGNAGELHDDVGIELTTMDVTSGASTESENVE